MMYLHVQDMVLVVPPYPYYIKEDLLDVPLRDRHCWYAVLCMTPALLDLPPASQGSYRTGLDDFLFFNLVFFSTFEELNLRSFVSVVCLVHVSYQLAPEYT
jgi:hypothetical protein